MAVTAALYAVGVVATLGAVGAALGEGALKLTPMIEANKIAEAQAAARVNRAELYEGVSYSGYLTVEKTEGVNLFFWFFPSKELIEAQGENLNANKSNNPLTIWMNGGPGVSAMQGLFWENGPIVPIEGTEDVEPRKEGSWLTATSLLYLDFPVNTGFSYSDSGKHRSSRKEYTADLTEFVRQFYKLFPGLLTNPLYLAGQSYAGKYCLALGAELHRNGYAPSLSGVILGGTLTDPEAQLPLYSDFMYEIGAISSAQAWETRNKAVKIIAEVLEGNRTSEGLGFNAEILMYAYPFGFSRENIYVDSGYADPSVHNATNAAGVREALHARTDVEFRNFNYDVYGAFHADFLKNTREEMSIMLAYYKVLVYTGSLDATVTNAMADAAVVAAKWPGRSAFTKAPRAPWFDSASKVLGWASKTSNLCRVVVQKAGHQTPRDAPAATVAMVTDFLSQSGCVKNRNDDANKNENE